MPFPRNGGDRPTPRRPEREPPQERAFVGFGDDLPAFLARPPQVVDRP